MKQDELWIVLRRYSYGPRKFLKSSRKMKRRLYLPRGHNGLASTLKWGREIYFDGNTRVVRGRESSPIL